MSASISSSGLLAARITQSASAQTYYTIRIFADRKLMEDAFRAYAYFRWVDDIIDADGCSKQAAGRLLARQHHLLETCYQGIFPDDLNPEEQMLADLVHNDEAEASGLKIYLYNMMWVMAFDAERRGEIISEGMLAEYTHRLAVAVTEALYHFIGHDQPTPMHEARYRAVEAAHIVHMLRDACEDSETGYYNIPGEIVEAGGASPQDVNSTTYRRWVCSRIGLARSYFRSGKQATALVKSLRCRLAGYAYIARFEWMLKTIERDRYCLRVAYPERKSLKAGLQIASATLTSALSAFVKPSTLAAKPVRIERQ